MKNHENKNLASNGVNKEQSKEYHIIQQSASLQYSSPFPPPEILAKYEALYPGVTEKIFNRFEKQSDHRMELEKKVIENNISLSKSGLNTARNIAYFALLITSVLGYLGETTLAGIIGGTTLISLVSTFVYGTNKQKKDLKEHDNNKNSV